MVVGVKLSEDKDVVLAESGVQIEIEGCLKSQQVPATNVNVVSL